MKERKKTDEACFLPLQLLMMLPEASGIHTTKLWTKPDRMEKFHGIPKPLLLTAAPLDYFSLLLIQNPQVSLTSLSGFALRYHSNSL